MQDWLSPPMVNGLLSVMVKTTLIYVFMLLGLRMVGRRTLGDLGPQELILVILVAKIVGEDLVPESTGLVGNLVGGFTLFMLVYGVNRIPALRHWIESSPVTVYENGQVRHDILGKHAMSERDLERTARDYGRKSYQDFESIVLERDGRLTGVLKGTHRPDIESHGHMT